MRRAVDFLQIFRVAGIIVGACVLFSVPSAAQNELKPIPKLPHYNASTPSGAKKLATTPPPRLEIESAPETAPHPRNPREREGTHSQRKRNAAAGEADSRKRRKPSKDKTAPAATIVDGFKSYANKDFKRACKHLLPLAVKGNGDAQIRMAVMYHDGTGCELNLEAAFFWYKKAAEQGMAGAQNAVGMAYEAGEGTSSNDYQAVDWYRRGAEQGHHAAQYNFGKMLENGSGIDTDLKAAVLWYRRSAAQGNVAAKTNLARLRDERRAAREQKRQEVRRSKLASATTAQPQYTEIERQTYPPRNDATNIVALQRRAVDENNPAVQFLVGVKYATGDGIRRDDAKAVDWYDRSAEQGYAAAQNNLGLMYKNGRGVTQSDLKAVEWYRRAAEQGDASAQHNLALMYASGRGVLQDYRNAHMWFNLATAQGSEESRSGRDAVAEVMTKADIAEAQQMARRWLKSHAR